MIKTLKASNGSVAKTGNVQVQPVTDDVGYLVKQQSSVEQSNSSKGTLPAHESALNISTTSTSGGTLSVSSNNSLSSIAKSLASDNKFAIPALDSKHNSILPSYASKGFSDASDAFVKPARKKSIKEEFTGISEQRPEIVMLTNFLPLVDKTVVRSRRSSQHVDDNGTDENMTDAGKFVNTHMLANNLRHADSTYIVRTARRNYSQVSVELEKKKKKLEAGIADLETNAAFLLGLVRNLHRLKSQLDLRDEIHIVHVDRVVSSFSKKTRTRNVPSAIVESTRRYLPPSFSVPDALVRLGYRDENIKLYASSKVWLQLLYELKTVLMFHSQDFIDGSVSTQKNDKSSSSVTKSRAKHFSLKNLELPAVSTLAVIEPSQVTQTATLVSNAWTKLYENVGLKTDEIHISNLFGFFAKEFRYSYALGQADTRRTILDRFGYDVQASDNVQLFDSVIGKIGNDITDVSATDDSLAALAFNVPQRGLNVLTFESKVIDDGDDSYEPGSSYYVDNVLETDGQGFSTERLETLSKRFARAYDDFSSVTDALGFMGAASEDEQSRSSAQFVSTLSDPVAFKSYLLSQIVNVNNGETVPFVKNDSLSAVYSFAAKNNSLKTLLFMYMLTRMFPSTEGQINENNSTSSFTAIDNAPTTNELVDRIMKILLDNVKNPTVGNTVTSVITKDAVRSCLKHGTVLTRFIESMMARVLVALKANGRTTFDDMRFNAGGGASVNGRTRYGDYVDTSMLMVAYDLILKMIGKYGNQSMVSLNTAGFQLGITSFSISKTNVNHKASIDEIDVRLRKETALAQKLTCCVLNTLEQLSESFNGYVSFLRSRSAITTIQKISTLIGDPGLVRFALGEQQIMVLSSAIKDLRDRIDRRIAVPSNADVDGDGSFDADDVVKLLDDSVVLPKLRDAFFGLFSTDAYASKKGYNKKIMTVGLPLGFSENLKQRINASKLKKTSFVDKQKDIVNVVVYKVDLQNSDIVYKPLKFLFEVSRFPVRNDASFVDIPAGASLSSVIASIPTRDFGNDITGNNPTYWSTASAEQPGERLASFSEESYSFLSTAEKNELAQNHVTSYLCEVYVRLLTGISVADYSFDLVEPDRYMDVDTTRLLVDHHISAVASSAKSSSFAKQGVTGGVLFATTGARRSANIVSDNQRSSLAQNRSNSSGTPGSVQNKNVSYQSSTSNTVSLSRQADVGTIDENLALVSQRNTPAALHGLRSISNLANSLSTLSTPESVSKKLLSPKQFDRVFNVVIDPDDFEIDYDKTMKTPQGKQAFELLMSSGDIVPASENDRSRSRKLGATVTVGARGFVQSRASYNFGSYKFRDRDKNQGDLAFEKYFITVETYGEEQD